MKTLIILFITFLLPFTSLAQIDTEFWFVAPEITENHADVPIFLVVSSQEETTTQVTITMPKQPAFDTINFILNGYETNVIDLTAFKALIESDFPGIGNYGMLIQSDAPITAQYNVAPNNNRDTYSLKGKNALGYEFFCPVQNVYNNHTNSMWVYPARNRIDVVATEDNTIVSFEITAAANGLPAGTLITTPVMQAGDTYSVVADNEAFNAHLGGTKITSNNKLIAVTLTDDSVDDPTGGHYDLLGDQLVPIQTPGDGNYTIGFNYIVTKTRITLEEYYFIVATEDLTNIEVDGVIVGSINKGETLPVIISGETDYISADKRVYLFHVGGFDGEMGGALIPSVDGCKGSSRISFPRTTEFDFHINLLVKGEAINAFYMEYEDGTTYHIPPDSFAIVSNTPEGEDWYYLNRAYNNFPLGQSPGVPIGQVTTIYNTESIFQMGLYNGLPVTGCSYGYFSDFKSQSWNSPLFVSDTISNVGSDTLILDAGEGFMSYEWQDGSTNQTFAVTSDTSQMYYVTVQHINSCEPITDSVFVNTEDIQPLAILSPVSACELSSTETISFQLQNNSGNIILAGEQIEFGIQINEGNPEMESHTLSTDIESNSSAIINLNADFDFSETGIYQIKLWCTKAIDNNHINDTLFASIETYGPADIELGEELTINAIPYTIDAGEDYASYLWHNGSTDQEFIIDDTNISPTGLYGVTVTNSNGCEGSDTKLINVDIIDWAVDEMLTSSEGCYNEYNGELSVQISNQSTVPVQQGRTFNIGYALNDNSVIEEQFTLTDSLYPQETLLHTFTNVSDFEPFSNIITIEVDTTNDIDQTNNTFGDSIFLYSPILTFDYDTIIPETFPLNLVAPDGFDTYEWNNGENGQTTVVNTSGTYILTIFDSYGCSDIDTIFVADPVGVTQHGIVQSDMNVWPNPVQNELFIKIDRKTIGKYTLEVISSTGEVVWKQKSQFTESVKMIPVSDFAEGVYLVRFVDDDEYIIENVIIKE